MAQAASLVSLMTHTLHPGTAYSLSFSMSPASHTYMTSVSLGTDSPDFHSALSLVELGAGFGGPQSSVGSRALVVRHRDHEELSVDLTFFASSFKRGPRAAGLAGDGHVPVGDVAVQTCEAAKSGNTFLDMNYTFFAFLLSGVYA